MYIETIQSKFIEMMDTFREEFEKLSEGEKRYEQDINSLKKPSQIHVFSSPSKQLHVVVVSHFPELPDKLVQVVNLSQGTYTDQLEDFLNNPMWKIRNDDMVNYDPERLHFGRSQFEWAFVDLGKRITRGYSPSESHRAGITMMALVNDKCSVWSLDGTLDSIDLKEEAMRFVKECKANFAQAEKQQTQATPEQVTQSIPETIQGYCTYCYPPILVGKFRPSIRDRILNREYEILNENAFMEEFEGITLVVSRGGLIGLETQNLSLAEQILNAVMGSAVCLGLQVHAVKFSEIAQTSFDKNKHTAGGFSYSESTVRMMQFAAPQFGVMHRLGPRMQISDEDMKMIIKTAKNIWHNTEHLNNVKLLLNAFTHLDNQEFSQSFIMSWSIVERYLHNLWNDKLQSSKITNKTRRFLEGWDTRRVIEILHLDQILSQDDYYRINNLTGLRNDVIHDSYEVTEKQARECYDSALQILRKGIDISLEIKWNRRHTI